MPEFNLLTNTDWRILNVIRQKGEVDRGHIIKETGATLATVSSSAAIGAAINAYIELLPSFEH